MITESYKTSLKLKHNFLGVTIKTQANSEQYIH